MKMPLVAAIDTRDGETNKDSRMTNVLLELDGDTPLSTLRPGLDLQLTSSGNAGGLTAFDGQLISVFGTTLYSGTPLNSRGTVATGFYDFVQAPI